MVLQPRALVRVLKRVRFFPLFALLLLLVPARAQSRWEGTLTQTQNGLSVTAQILVQAPDLMRIEIARDDALDVPQQVIVAKGDQTLRYEPATKRLFRARFNALKSWNRGWNLSFGGPANFFFAAAPAGVVTETEGRFARRDRVLFGGGGENAFYAAVKVPAQLYAARVELSGAPVAKRVETDIAGATALTAQINFKSGLPASAQVAAAGETVNYAYALRSRAEPFDEATWTIDGAQNALAEDADLQSPPAYLKRADPGDAADHLNAGVALWRGAGDYRAAQGELSRAGQLAPQASAPALALFEMALQTRQLELAHAALAKLEPLGLDAAEMQSRRARLALVERDWAGALAALDAAIAAAPQSASLQLARAQTLLGQGDLEGARASWKRVMNAQTSPAARVAAATLLVQSAAPDETLALDEVPPTSETGALARALLELRHGGEAALDEKRVAPIASDEARVALALGYERAGRDGEARALWETVEKTAPDAIKNGARAHLMALAARRGDAPTSLAAFVHWRDALSAPAERERATAALFDAWQKSFQRESLGLAIANRAAATRADDADARLALAYQEAFGDENARTAAVENGLGRAPNAPFWLGKKAEILASQTFGLINSTNAKAAQRDILLGRTRDLLDRAVAGAQENNAQGEGALFYQQQRALFNAQAASKGGYDAGRAVRDRAAARASLDDLVAQTGDDPDSALSAGLAWQSFGLDEGAAKARELAGRALLSAPGDGDRHTLILAARQSIAFAASRLNDPAGAADQYEALLLEARSASEQTGIAAGYLALLTKFPNPAGAASLMARVAAQPWDYAEARAELENLAARAAALPNIAEIEAPLAAARDDAALLAWGHIARARLDRAEAALRVPDAPAIADADRERAVIDLNAALAALKNVEPKGEIGARINAWLGEFGALEPEAALERLKRAVAVESRAPALRLALVEALPDDEALAELRRAAPLLPDDAETARRLSVLWAELGDQARALSASAAAYNEAARDPLTRTNDFQRIAFTRARLLWEAGQSAPALELYNNLAASQWPDLDRAAALLALRARYNASDRAEEANRLTPKIQALGFDLPALQRAAAFVEEVES